jgi:hypothetical protein
MSANFESTRNRRLLSSSFAISFSNSKYSKTCRALEEKLLM